MAPARAERLRRGRTRRQGVGAGAGTELLRTRGGRSAARGRLDRRGQGARPCRGGGPAACVGGRVGRVGRARHADRARRRRAHPFGPSSGRPRPGHHRRPRTHPSHRRHRARHGVAGGTLVPQPGPRRAGHRCLRRPGGDVSRRRPGTGPDGRRGAGTAAPHPVAADVSGHDDRRGRRAGGAGRGRPGLAAGRPVGVRTGRARRPLRRERPGRVGALVRSGRAAPGSFPAVYVRPDRAPAGHHEPPRPARRLVDAPCRSYVAGPLRRARRWTARARGGPADPLPPLAVRPRSRGLARPLEGRAGGSRRGHPARPGECRHEGRAARKSLGRPRCGVQRRAASVRPRARDHPDDGAADGVGPAARCPHRTP